MDQTLLNATDALGRMIDAARGDLACGRAVDLGTIESVVTAIYRLVAQNAEAARSGVGPALADKLDALMAELGALEVDLVRRHAAAAGA